MKGRVIINFERDEEEERCSYNLNQDGESILENEDLINLFEYIIRDLMD